MKTRKLKQICAILCTGLMCLSNISGCGESTNKSSSGSNNNNVELTIMGTSDVHDYLMNYDYYTTSEIEKSGLVKISTIIKQYRKDSEEKNKKDINNVVVFDNGDLIQGNPLGDYFARVKAIQSGTEHPVYKALNVAGYDGATLGNHEFNYGLDYLHQIINDSKVPIINTNIYNAQTKEPEFKQYEIINKKVVDDSGNEKEVKIGVLGFVPPQILEWDKINLEEKIEVKDIVESAKEMVPKVKDEGADVIVALSHSGYGNDNYVAGEEDESYQLTKVEGINAVITGHAHDTFPSEAFAEANKDLPNVDVAKGTMNGVPTFEPAKYAEGVGVIKLTLTESDDKYSVSDGTAEFVGVENVENDAELVEALKEDHDAVIVYVNSPVGKTLRDINTYFALVSDNDAVQLVSDAQIGYAKNKVNEEAALNAYKDLPILSAAAPFKVGLSKDGTKADDYVEIKAGDVSIKDMANIYKYPNTAAIMKLKGTEIKNWLEMCAGLFNTIDVNSTDNQELLNKDYPAFNFDTLDGVTYEFDVTQPPKYDVEGNVINENSSRVVNLKYNGNDVKDEDEFLVITNNYRASGGGHFPIFNSDDAVAYLSSDETRQIITDFVKEKGTIDIAADNNWKLKNAQTQGKVTFLSSVNAEALVEQYPYISVDEAKDNNLIQFIYDLSK